MGINSLGFNGTPYFSSDRRKVNVPVEEDRRGVNYINSAFDFGNINNEYNKSNPSLNTEESAFLTQKPGDNFFLNKSDYHSDPSEYASMPPPKAFVLSRQPEFGMNTQDKNTKHNDDNIIMKALTFPITPVRRIESVPDDVQHGNIVPALCAVGLTTINFPEDIRDIQTAWHQASSFFKGLPYEGPYNYMKAQHEFSFFRGTLLQWMVDKTKHPKMAEILQKYDKSLWQTSFGDKILSWLKTDPYGFENVRKYNKDTNTWELAKDINGIQRTAAEFKGKWFGEITARALSRTTLIGTGLFALMELYNITKAATKGNTVDEKVKGGTKQTIKSGINLASMTAAIGYGGAIGAKYGKGFGSLVGMGIGAALGGFASNKLQDIIS